MNENFCIREIIPDSAKTVIESIGFDKSYVHASVKKYNFKLIKICNLSCPQANIIKQVALSAGADAAVHREVITCKVEKTDLLLGGTIAQLENICQKLKNQPFKLSELSDHLLKQLTVKKHTWSDKTYIMGILNVTPDSFSDGGKYFDPEKAAEHAKEIIKAGADIIDIGGESTRPHSKEVNIDEELKRVLPVIEKIRSFNTTIPLSIDTRHAEVAKQAVQAGANIINDVSGLEWDGNMVNIAAELQVPVVIMHSVGSSETRYDYKENIVDAVYKDLCRKTQKALSLGLKPENIIIDPGIGFGKTVEHNLELVKRIGEFKSLGYPVLIGISRKSFISGDEDVTLALNTYAATNGADIIRVHNVDKHVKAMKVLQTLNNIS
ncbi:MAG: dihydropteroate synthase [Candidatus Melainabacteria bacterium GWF2_37_15]|nr:MAG: dihydropteroate synthase [Candidatus Melainabacteria bacterium GWF2_37_15]